MVQPPRPPDVPPPPERVAASVGATPEQRRFAKSLREGMRREWVTLALVAANVVVFAAMIARGADLLVPEGGHTLLAFGANSGALTLRGEWWRLFSSMFLHAGVLHVGFNMYALWIGGRLLERIYGHVGYGLLYFFAGLVGSVASATFGPSVASVGASGAVFGVFGALLAFLVRRRRLLPAPALKQLRSVLLMVVGFNVVFGFVVPGIDQAAHLGGLAGGFAAGLVIAPAFEEGRLKRPWALYSVLLVAGAALVAPIATGAWAAWWGGA